jgi:predicted anti-sigma-YlaC factor YlaD
VRRFRSSGERCDRARLWVSLELDGELSEVESALLEEHVARCGTCATLRSDLGALTGAIRDTPLETPGRRFALDPAPRRLQPRASRRTALALRFAAAAALAIVAAGLGVFVSSLGPEPPRPAPPAAEIVLVDTEEREHHPRPSRREPELRPVGGV